MAEGGKNPIDVHVGGRVKLRRRQLGLSQAKLAERLGVTFQQVQKYERGANRICAGRLLEIAGILGVTVAYFFEGLPDGAQAGQAGDGFGDFLSSEEGLLLNRAFLRIRDRRTRRAIIGVVKALADP
jgi:transcriptional regulator with XRE-family HTH domain